MRSWNDQILNSDHVPDKYKINDDGEPIRNGVVITWEEYHNEYVLPNLYGMMTANEASETPAEDMSGDSGETNNSVESGIDWGNVLLDLSDKDVTTLHTMSITLGAVTVLSYSAGPEVGAFVNVVMSVPATGISIATTLDSWGDYYRLDNPQNGDLIRAWSNTIVSASCLIYWPLAVPGAIIQIMDQKGQFDNFWEGFNE